MGLRAELDEIFKVYTKNREALKDKVKPVLHKYGFNYDDRFIYSMLTHDEKENSVLFMMEAVHRFMFRDLEKAHDLIMYLKAEFPEIHERILNNSKYN